jgi:hypothetical protein
MPARTSQDFWRVLFGCRRMIMSCSQHSSIRNRKSHSVDAPYCRHPDWWKDSDMESESNIPKRKYFEKRKSHYVVSKKKTWSIILITQSGKLEEEFNRLVAEWKRDTFYMSSLTKIYAHPAYERIKAMGTAGIPFVLRQLRQDQGKWFYALKYMAGRNVAEGIDNFEDAKAAWLGWGHKHNYI